MIKHPKDEFGLAWLVAWRELRDQLRDWRIIFPMVALTLLLPFLADLGAQAAINFTTQYGTPLIADRLVPFLLMVVGYFPITVSLVIALESFVGEKERGTIEPLLSSPLKDWQLFMGKLLAGTIAPLFTAYLGITVYMIGLYFRHIPFPDANRMAETLVLTAVQAFLMVTGAILISTQATSVRASNLMASFIVIPMALLIQGESVMLFWGNDMGLWLVVGGVCVMMVLLARVGVAHFQREALLGREIDVLNIRWIFRTFWLSFKGKAGSIPTWFSQEVWGTLKKQAVSIWLTVGLGILSAIGGYIWVALNTTRVLHAYQAGSMSGLLNAGTGVPVADLVISFPVIWGHNLRAIAIILLLGLFSFGVLGVFVFLVNTTVIGVVLALEAALGVSPLKLAVFGILPHGIFEIPALILSSAAVLYIGIALVTPRSQLTLGEVLIDAVADWAKVAVGLVLPLLTIAAVLETWVTPVLLHSMMK
ncbi:MAG TPA: stage II sporulation protein M [Anaerolineales bacterium]|nr:stage II sporulation protein M [Anaerolineales bacterium]